MAFEAQPLGNGGAPQNDEQVKLALIYQLHERLQFVRPPDAIVGSLLSDLSTLVSAENHIGQAGALKVLRLARDYLKGQPNVSFLQTYVDLRLEEASAGQRQHINAPGRSFAMVWLVVAAFLAASALILAKRLLEQFAKLRTGVAQNGSPIARL